MISLLTTLGLVACNPTPTFTDVQAEVFTPSCAFSSCHGSAEEGELSLDGDGVYANLVGVESSGAAGLTRVVAGDSSTSYLMWKLDGSAGIEGDPMPPSGGLSDDQVEMVRDWIDAGALND